MREELPISDPDLRIGKSGEDSDLKASIDDCVFREGGGRIGREAEAERSNDRRELPTSGLRRCRFGAGEFP